MRSLSLEWLRMRYKISSQCNLLLLWDLSLCCFITFNNAHESIAHRQSFTICARELAERATFAMSLLVRNRSCHNFVNSLSLAGVGKTPKAPRGYGRRRDWVGWGSNPQPTP